MRISEAQIAALRAFLVHDPDAITRLAQHLGGEGAVGYQHLANAALSLLAVRRFPRYVDADLVRYVGSVRADRVADGPEYDIDPVMAEQVLRYSLGKDNTARRDPAARFRAVAALLDALAQTEFSSEADIDDLVAQARTLADRWLAEPV